MSPWRAIKLAVRSAADLFAVCDAVFLATALRRAADGARARRRFAAAGGNLAAGAVVVNLDRLELGTGAVVQSGSLLHCGGLDWSAGRGRIQLGDRVYVGHDCILYGAGDLEIGSDVLLGPRVILTSQGHGFQARDITIREQPLMLAPVAVGNDVWIGAGAVVLPGIRIGQGAIVAAGAVVTRDVAPFQIVGGVPARVLSDRPAGVDGAKRLIP